MTTPPPLLLRTDPIKPGAASTQDGHRRFTGIAYSGQPINDHGFWGTVMIDVATTTAANRIPVLIDHDRTLRAGFAALSMAEHQIAIADGVLLNNEHGQAIAAESDQGFPWQLSVHVQPGSIEEVEAGVTISVNGQSLPGPATILRHNRIREVSFTPTGADDQTTAAALSHRYKDSPMPPDDKTDKTDLAALKANLEQLNTRLTAAETRATAAETKAAELETKLTAAEEQARTAEARAVRLSAVKELFQALGKPWDQAVAQPYLDMPEASFTRARDDLLAMRRSLPAALFTEQATAGVSGATERAATVTRLNAL